jgi:hypothetical protein
MEKWSLWGIVIAERPLYRTKDCPPVLWWVIPRRACDESVRQSTMQPPRTAAFDGP